MQLLRLLAVVMAIAALHGPVAAQPALSPAASQACDALTAKVVKATGADVLRKSPTGLQVFFRDPFAKEMSLGCIDPGNPKYAHPFVEASYDSAYPSLYYFDLLAMAANAALGFQVQNVKDASERCKETALANANETATIDAGAHIHIECQAFTRGDGGTSIGVFWDTKR